MRKSVLVWLVVFPVVGLFASQLVAQQSNRAPAVAASQLAFEKIVDEYYRIHEALAADTTDGVATAAQKIGQVASGVPQKNGAKGPDFAAISRAATALQGAKGLAQVREQFYELSKPIVAELKSHPPTQKPAFAYYCSMAKKSWVQNKKEVRNPYYGKEMLTCGQPL